MAIIERPAETTDARPAGTAPAPTAATNYGYLRRPVETTGWRSWAFTVDHKKIGIMYMVTAMFFFLVGGLEAVAIRLQLALPNGKILNADLYNQMFTMHATTMVFLFVMPMAVQWWSVWYPGAEPGGGSYIAQRMLASKSEKDSLGGTLFFKECQYALFPGIGRIL